MLEALLAALRCEDDPSYHPKYRRGAIGGVLRAALELRDAGHIADEDFVQVIIAYNAAISHIYDDE